jgi:hypothetical protein
MTDEQMKKSVGKIICYITSDGYNKFLHLLLKADKLSFRCFNLVVLPLNGSHIQTWTKIVPDWFESF